MVSMRSIALASALLLGIATSAMAAPTRLAMDVGGRTLTRTQNGAREWVYQWPGVYFEAHFKGPQVSLRLDDPSNVLNLLVDGHPLMTLHEPGRTTVTLGDLGDGAHVIRLEKRSETQSDLGAFAGFFVPARADALPAQRLARQIEFIGDSTTAGYGDTSAFGKCDKDAVFETTDTQQAFGPLVAKHYGAEYQVLAYSGIGMVRSAGVHPKYLTPMLWPRALFDDPTPDPAPWSPQIVMVAVGGNDFSTPVHDGEPFKSEADLSATYQSAYIDFVHTLRAKYPKALIVMVWSTDFRPGYTAAAQQIYATLTAQGFAGLGHVALPALARTGCNNHANVHDHAAVAALLEGYIDAQPGVWQGL